MRLIDFLTCCGVENLNDNRLFSFILCLSIYKERGRMTSPSYGVILLCVRRYL
nr:MAG TPA: hypothetical protein [Caudoviricetes sp.]